MTGAPFVVGASRRLYADSPTSHSALSTTLPFPIHRGDCAPCAERLAGVAVPAIGRSSSSGLVAQVRRFDHAAVELTRRIPRVSSVAAAAERLGASSFA